MGWDDALEFSTGLLDDFDFTVTFAQFSTDERYGDALLLQLDGTTDSLDVPENHVWISMGKGWVSVDGGKTAKSEAGKKLNQSTYMAKWLTRVVGELDVAPALAARGEWYEAKTWIGTKWHLKNETFEGGKDIEVKPKLMPTAFLGVVEDGKTSAAKASSGPSASDAIAAAKAKQAAAQAAASATATADSGSVSATGATGTLEDQIREIFGRHDDFATAQTEAFSLPGVTEDEELVNKLLDESGLWTEVKA